jgi:hypothetical protein
MEYVIVNNLQDERKNLMEGKKSGLGFAFAKHNKENDTYETIMPISTCKDYLNDVVVSERLGEGIGQIYGFDYKPIKLFNDDHNFLVCKDIGVKDNSSLKVDNINSLINKIEDMLGIENKSKAFASNDDQILIYVSNQWCKEGYLISMFSLLARIGVRYNPDKDPIEFLQTKNVYDNESWMTGKNIPMLIDKIKEHGFFKQHHPNLGLPKIPSRSYHNHGADWVTSEIIHNRKFMA